MCAECDGWKESICQAAKARRATKQNPLLILMELLPFRLDPQKAATTNLPVCVDRPRRYMSLSGTITRWQLWISMATSIEFLIFSLATIPPQCFGTERALVFTLSIQTQTVFR